MWIWHNIENKEPFDNKYVEVFFFENIMYIFYKISSYKFKIIENKKLKELLLEESNRSSLKALVFLIC